MSHTLVSVIMPSFKMGQFIGEALESVGSQTYPYWEVLVVDDAGPEDGTRAAVEAFAAKHPDHRIEYIRHETNQGVSVARRTAFEVARGEYLAFLDADDSFLPEKLARQVGDLEVNSDCVLIHGRVEEHGDLSPDQRPAADWFSRGPKTLTYNLWSDPEALRVSRICNSTVLCRKQRVLLSDFPDNMVFQFEDWLLWLLLAGRGQFRYDPQPLTRYRHHDEAFSLRMRRNGSVAALARIEMLIHLFKRGGACSSKVAAAIWQSLNQLFGSASAGNNQANLGRRQFTLSMWLALITLRSAFAQVLRKIAWPVSRPD